jgi:hypothetical protein
MNIHFNVRIFQLVPVNKVDNHSQEASGDKRRSIIGLYGGIFPSVSKRDFAAFPLN